jgi:hypothetical protein
VVGLLAIHGDKNVVGLGGESNQEKAEQKAFGHRYSSWRKII